MHDFKDLAASRRSVRRYKDIDIDINEIIDCVKIATTAPSGCNSQCWKFVVIHDKNKIKQLTNIITKKQKEFLAEIHMEYDMTYVESRIKLLTFFQSAPVCIAVCMTRLDYYDTRMEKALYDYGYSLQGINGIICKS
ncbi:MAG: nitroreductase family protein [Treponema sp.]|nr:nitroreductase family protein [Treponema sp.]